MRNVLVCIKVSISIEIWEKHIFDHTEMYELIIRLRLQPEVGFDIDHITIMEELGQKSVYVSI